MSRSVAAFVHRYERLFEMVAIVLLIPAALLEIRDMYTAAGTAVSASERYNARYRRHLQLTTLLEETAQHRSFLKSERASLLRDLAGTRVRNSGLRAAMEDAQTQALLQSLNSANATADDAEDALHRHTAGVTVMGLVPLLTDRLHRSLFRTQLSAKVSLPPPPRQVVFVDAAVNSTTVSHPRQHPLATAGNASASRLDLYRAVLPALLADRGQWSVYILNTRLGPKHVDGGDDDSLCSELLRDVEHRGAANCLDVAADVPWEPAQRVNYALRLSTGTSRKSGGVTAIIPVGRLSTAIPTATAQAARRLVPPAACETDPAAALNHLTNGFAAMAGPGVAAAWACRPTGAAVLKAESVWRAAGEADVRLPSVAVALEDLVARAAYDLRGVVVDVADGPLAEHGVSVGASFAAHTTAADAARAHARSAASGRRQRTMPQTGDGDGLPALHRWGRVAIDIIQNARSAVARYDMAATVPGGLPKEVLRAHRQHRAVVEDVASSGEDSGGGAPRPTGPVIMMAEAGDAGNHRGANADAVAAHHHHHHRGGLFRPDADVADIVRGRFHDDADPDAAAAAAAGLTPRERGATAQREQLEARNTHPADLVVDWPTRVYVEEKWLNSAGLGGAPYGVELLSVGAAPGLDIEKAAAVLWQRRTSRRREAESREVPPRRGGVDDCYVHRIVAEPRRRSDGVLVGTATKTAEDRPLQAEEGEEEATAVIGFVVAMLTPVAAQLDDRAVMVRACVPEELLVSPAPTG